ncbi:hypothetical protein HS088_TW22G00068 [Tripterygium wilfordii]|uniref:Cation/H+ exchanger domain-containing protein n=1 Tax=Tripterygium wilfordii TaxID=458696 RepID=A0A7J7BWV5_TRIWF|nr:hypothetical protein HS088_TW22G00068 [Tripterygium wilfordii]
MVRFIPGNHSLPTSESWQFGNSGNNQKMVAEVEPVGAHRMSFGFPDKLPPGFPVLCLQSDRGHPLGIFQGDPLSNSFGLILLEIAIVVVASRVVRFLLKPLKQPRVVSDLIGGIFVGPSLLGRNKTFSTRLFPENTKFVVRNMGIMGFMYFLFISGVKMDLTLVKKSGRKHVAIATFGVLAPLLAVLGLAYIIRPQMDKELAKHSSIGAVASSVAIPAFPVLFPILKELNLLSSEVGRMALSTAIISDAIGLNAIVAFEAIKQGEADSKSAIWYVISTIVLAIFMVTAVRKFMIWIIERTPEGKPVDQSYVTVILLGVLIIGFLTDMFGIAIANGSLWLGLVIPDGPPLGSTLVDKTETFIMEILMPFSFAYIGLFTDVYSMASIGWSGVAPLFYMVLIGYAFKFIATLLPSLFYNIPLRDSLTLSLIMSLRGQVEILVYVHWMDKKIVGIPRFSLMILLTLAVTAVATPLIAVFYDPTRPYMVNKRRTIQHTPPNTEMGIVLCIHDRESVNGLINLLEISYPTTTSRFDVYAIHLVELLGRAAPVFVDHDKEEEDDRRSNAHTADDTIYSALKLYQEVRAEFVNIHTFTVQAPKRTMYQNICEMALLNKATIIIIPYHKEHLDDVTGTEIVRRGIQSVNSSVLAHAPCSVGVLVDKGELRHPIVGRRDGSLETVRSGPGNGGSTGHLLR